MCDRTAGCKSTMWATDRNPNYWYRRLCWMKTVGFEAELEQRIGSGIDCYIRVVPGYHINEALNAEGPGKCSHNTECDGGRYCRNGSCYGVSGLKPHKQTLAEEAQNRGGTLIVNGPTGVVNIPLSRVSAHTFADGSQIIRKQDGTYYIVNGGETNYKMLILL